MRPWDIYQWKFPHGDHPAVIVSPAARCANPDIETVNVVGCSSKPARRPAETHELILDQADGLDWPTLCRCDVLYLARKDELETRRGSLSPERRRILGQKLIRLFGLFQP
jgi:mRNA-degrading endonuclease toxin of MazEF toxin-antitoxin module